MILFKIFRNLRQSVFFLIFIIFAGCQKNPLEESTLKLSLSANPTSLDPALVTDVNGGKLVCMIFSRLVQFSPQLKIIPDLALRWTVSKDLLIYTFYLDPRYVFSDGTPVRAQNVIESFERIINPKTKSPRSWIFEKVQGLSDFQNKHAPNVTGFRSTNDDRLEITLTEPFSSFLSLLTMPNAAITKTSDSEYTLIGSGPMELADWKHDQWIRLKKNPFSNHPTTLKKIELFIQTETLTRSTDFDMGNIDIMEVPTSELLYYSNHPDWKNRIQQIPGLNTYYLGMNCAKGPLRDIQLRRLIDEAIDADKILTTFYANKAVKANGPVPGSLLQFIPGEKIPGKNLKTPLHLKLIQSKRSENSIVTEVFQTQLQKVKIKVEIVSLEWSSFKARLIQGDYDLFYLSWWADYPDAENFLTPLFHSKSRGTGGNYTGINDPFIDMMLDRANQTSDLNQRIEIFLEVSARVQFLSPMVFLWHKSEQMISQPWIQKYQLSPVYTILDELNIKFDWSKRH